MTRSTNMEHVEVLRDLSEVCRAAIKAGDWKVDGACDPDAVLRRADAAIAALSAPQPPAEAQPDDLVAADNEKAADRACLAMIARGYYWNGEAWALPGESEAQGGGDVCPQCKGNPGLDCNSFGRTAAPPSAPVDMGVRVARLCEEASEVLEAVGVSGVPLPSNWRWPLADELGGIAALARQPAPSAPVGVEKAARRLLEAYDDSVHPFEAATAAEELRNALAQQPESDGGFTAADMMDARQEGRKEAQQHAAVDGESVIIDGRRYDLDTVRTALLGLAADVTRDATQQGGEK